MSPSSRPLWFAREPSAERVAEFLRAQSGATVSYEAVGATRTKSPAGYNFDHNRARLGTGDAAFEAACNAIRSWKMFPRPWTQITPANAPIVEGTVIAMLAHALGCWWLNACKIVYVVEETTPLRRFGFAYGTLPAHVETGEECFCVEQDADGSVWYDLRAFSRPRYWPVRLAKPLARGLQRRFARESLRAMQDAVAAQVSILP
jgi:uncharacterized protein (UPF0548 family)